MVSKSHPHRVLLFGAFCSPLALPRPRVSRQSSGCSESPERPSGRGGVCVTLQTAWVRRLRTCDRLGDSCWGRRGAEMRREFHQPMHGIPLQRYFVFEANTCIKDIGDLLSGEMHEQHAFEDIAAYYSTILGEVFSVYACSCLWPCICPCSYPACSHA